MVKNNILDGAHPSGQDYGFIAGGAPVEATNLVTLHSDNGTGTDPKYTNPASGDYTLAAGSPAIDAGTVLPGVTDGYAGSKPEVGAYESGTTKWVVGCDWTGCF